MQRCPCQWYFLQEKWLVVSNMSYDHPYLGKSSTLTSICFRWVGSTTNEKTNFFQLAEMVVWRDNISWCSLLVSSHHLTAFFLAEHLKVMKVHPRRLTCNLKMMVWVQMIFLFQGAPYSQVNQPFIFRGVRGNLSQQKTSISAPWNPCLLVIDSNFRVAPLKTPFIFGTFFGRKIILPKTKKAKELETSPWLFLQLFYLR